MKTDIVDDENAALRARIAELEQLLHRFQHGETIESDYICPVAEQMLGVIEERDAARRELAEAMVQREMLVGRVVRIRMTDWINKRDGNFTEEESLKAERATREGVENWLRKDRAALAHAREGE